MRPKYSAGTTFTSSYLDPLSSTTMSTVRFTAFTGI